MITDPDKLSVQWSHLSHKRDTAECKKKRASKCCRLITVPCEKQRGTVIKVNIISNYNVTLSKVSSKFVTYEVISYFLGSI